MNVIKKSILYKTVVLIVLIACTSSFKPNHSQVSFMKQNTNSYDNTMTTHVNSDVELLEFVYLVFRHGHRQPIINEGTKDMLDNEYPNLGGGELTSVGKRQHFLAGQNDREKYRSFMSNSFSNKELYVMSTNYNRTIESAQARIQGFYADEANPTLTPQQQTTAYPSGVFNFLSDDVKSKISALNSDALPKKESLIQIHPFISNQKFDLLYSPSVCPGALGYSSISGEKEYSYDAVDQFKKKHSEMIKSIYDTELKRDDASYSFIWKFCDSYVSVYYNNLSLKKITEKGYTNTEEILNDCEVLLKAEHLSVLFGSAKNHFMSRLSASGALNDVVEYMERRINLNKESTDAKKNKTYKDFSSPKMKWYSAHDTSIGAQLGALSYAFNDKAYTDVKNISFASNIKYELYSNSNNKNNIEENYTVKILYNEELISSYIFSEFKSVVLDAIISQKEINNFCNFTPDSNEFVSNNHTILLLVSSALIVVTIILFIALIMKSYAENKENKKEDMYTEIDSIKGSKNSKINVNTNDTFGNSEINNTKSDN